jgi:hypothetical protein
LEAVVEPGCAAIATTGPLLLRSGVLTGSGVSEYFITPDSFHNKALKRFAHRYRP